MKLARIIAPFSLSAVLFILSFFSLKSNLEGFFVLMLFIVGVILAVVGIVALFSDEK